MRSLQRATWRALVTAIFVPLVSSSTATSAVSNHNSPNLTRIHEAGRCAIRGQCGRESIFGGELPCADNGLAESPDPFTSDLLIEVCGDEWRDRDVCCRQEQVEALKSKFGIVHGVLGSCPACTKNFFDLFCTFSCSPDQSLFVNVTDTVESNGKILVTELDQLVSDGYSEGFYGSCKDVQNSATGGRAMLFFGNAKNSTQLLQFLGDKKPFGSPFQINFPRPGEHDFKDMKAVLGKGDAKKCRTDDPDYRCACVDCEDSCTDLPALKGEEECTVGLLPCLSFGVIIAYSVVIALLVLAVSGHIAAAEQRKSKNERLQLLQDSRPDDADDERDVMHGVGGLLDRPNKQYVVNIYCDRTFSTLGRIAANFPGITIGTSVVIVGLLALGLLRFEVEQDPVKLWVAPDSDAAKEKAIFDANFGPFFRAEQAFLVNDTTGPVLSYDTLKWWYDVEQRVDKLESDVNQYSFDDVCYKPLEDTCVVQSITQYGLLANGFGKDTWENDLKKCTSFSGDQDCLPSFMQPLPVERLLGGYNASDESVLDASALIVTWVVKNYNIGEPELDRAVEWENAFNRLMLEVQDEARERGLRLSFNSEISLELELNKTANTDAKIVVISYVVMFIYASLALGSTTVPFSMIARDPAAALVQSKFLLSVVGILIVLMSVLASVGLFAAAGVKATLIIAAVIPFLVLAVGVDNIFLIVHEFERVNITHADESVPDRVARALGRMGPSILLSAMTETVVFALGAAVGMPAVRNFAAYAAGAVFINALLQVTMFVSVLALNQERVEAGRADCIPCIKIQGGMDSSMPNGYGGAPFSGVEEEGWLSRFVGKHYAPALLGNKTRVGIMTIFLGFFVTGIALLPDVQLGLDQRIAIPRNSYLIKYFDDLADYFRAGPPVYFVTRDVNVTERKHQRELCAKFSACGRYSLTNILDGERRRADAPSYISDATASWIDDFFAWVDPGRESCCIEEGRACFADRMPRWSADINDRPSGDEFINYVQRWLGSLPDGGCPVAGKTYSNAVVVDNNTTNIHASHFRTAHTPLRTQHDLIASYASARRIATSISANNHGIEVFPYSKHYIFVDQYLSLVSLSTVLIGAALAFIFLIVSLFLGSPATGLVVTVTISMVVIDVVGTMALTNVSLNAVSLVNIIICIGIGVEFCAHIARTFTIPSSPILERAGPQFRGTKARAWAALVDVGGSVFSGITATKLLGILVLAFTRSKIFEVYYFRIWLALVLWAALHALVFLPVALSLLGGSGYVDSEGGGGSEQDLASQRYQTLPPEGENDPDDY